MKFGMDFAMDEECFREDAKNCVSGALQSISHRVLAGHTEGVIYGSEGPIGLWKIEEDDR